MLKNLKDKTKNAFPDTLSKSSAGILGLFLVSIFLTIIISSPTFAAQPTFIESLVKDGIGIRQLGMGAAGTAVADDSMAVFYNPAGLGNQFFGYNTGMEDANQLLEKVNSYSALNFRGYGYASWKKESFSGDSGSVYAYSWAKESNGGSNWGLTYKLINGNLPNGQSQGYGIDLGILGSGNGGSRWGILFSDLCKNTALPTTIRAGVSSNNLMGFLFACDFEMRNIKALGGPNIYIHTGVEKAVVDGLTLRAGYNADRFTGGVSLIFPPVAFDYALLTSPDPLTESIQLFGVRYGI